MPFNADFARSQSSVDDSPEQNKITEPYLPEKVLQSHFFENDVARQCRNCCQCTSRCCEWDSFQLDELSPGEDCCCGMEDAGCARCGLCHRCASEVDCDIACSADDFELEEDSSISVDADAEGLSVFRGQTGTIVDVRIDEQEICIFFDKLNREIVVSPREIRNPYIMEALMAKRDVKSSKQDVNSMIASMLEADEESRIKCKTIKPVAPTSNYLRNFIPPSAELLLEQWNEMDSDEINRSGRMKRHSGWMKCNCGHQLGKIKEPLNPSYYHLAGQCKWTCCNKSWDITTCSASTSNENSNTGISVRSYKECIEDLKDIKLYMFPCETWCFPYERNENGDVLYKREYDNMLQNGWTMSDEKRYFSLLKWKGSIQDEFSFIE